MTKWLRFACCALAILLIFVGIFHHEAWRDEADVWLVARDLSIADLFRMTRYMGHPSLWYLLVMPLAKSGLPYLSMFLLHGIVISMAIVLLAWKSPLPEFLKILLPLNYFFLFEYAIVARTYAISILILFLVALIFQERERRRWIYGLLVLLLMSTNAYALLMGMGLAALTLWEVTVERRRALLPALALMGVGFLAAYLQLAPPLDGQIVDVFCRGMWWTPDRAIQSSFLPVYGDGRTWVLVFGCVALLASFLWFWSRPKIFFVGLTSYGLLGLFYFCKFGHAARHFGFVLLFLLFLTWIMLGESRSETEAGGGRIPDLGRRLSWGLWSISLLAGAVIGLRIWFDELENVFSTSKPMAEFIERNVPPDAIIAVHPHVYTESVLAYMNTRPEFYYPSRRAMGSHMSWDVEYMREIGMLRSQVLYILFTELRDESREVYFLTNDTVERAELEVVVTMEGLDRMAIGPHDEVFRLYRWKRPVH